MGAGQRQARVQERQARLHYRHPEASGVSAVLDLLQLQFLIYCKTTKTTKKLAFRVKNMTSVLNVIRVSYSFLILHPHYGMAM